MPRNRKEAGRRWGAARQTIEFAPLNNVELDVLAEAMLMSRDHFDRAQGAEAPLSTMLERAIWRYVTIRAAVPFMPSSREVARHHRRAVVAILDLLDLIQPPIGAGPALSPIEIAADPTGDLDMAWRLTKALRRHGELACALEADAARAGPKRRNDDLALASDLRIACLSAGIGWSAGSKATDDDAAERPPIRLLVGCLHIAVDRLRALDLPTDAVELATEEARGVLVLAPSALAQRVRSAARKDRPRIDPLRGQTATIA